MTAPRGKSGLAAATAWLALAICAISACSSGQSGPSVASLPSHPARPPAALTQSQEFQRLVKFAGCMRSRGIDVPDPQPGQVQIPVATDPSTAAALRACQHWLPGLNPGGGVRPNGNLAAVQRDVDGHALGAQPARHGPRQGRFVLHDEYTHDGLHCCPAS